MRKRNDNIISKIVRVTDGPSLLWQENGGQDYGLKKPSPNAVFADDNLLPALEDVRNARQVRTRPGLIKEKGLLGKRKQRIPHLTKQTAFSKLRQPPPVASFLKQLLKIHGGADGRASQNPRLEAAEIPIQLDEAKIQLKPFESSVSGHRVPRHLLASPPMRGCHLGTCQIQNLANLLYRYGGNSQKDESHKNNKGTSDPMGYGRRKRQAVGHGMPAPT
ncbi:ADM protein [Varanus komodoensis]|nr:ADM protein [Varanus komodoensis]